MQSEETSNNAKQRNKTKAVAVKRKRSSKKTADKRPKTTGSPCDALDSTSVLAIANSLNHDSIKHHVAEGKKKRRKRAQKHNNKNTAAVKPQNAPKQPATGKAKSNLQTSVQNSTKVITKYAINSFDRPRKSDDSTEESQISGTSIMGLDEVVPKYITGSNNNQPQEKIHNKDIPVAGADKTQVAWEHFALLIEEFMLAQDVKM